MGLPGGIGVATVVLFAVFVAGVLAGRAKRRFGLLLGGLVALVVAGALVAGVHGGAADRAGAFAALLATIVPLLVSYLAGWLCARATWFARVVVVAVAALLLAAFPYPAAGAAVARLLPPGSPTAAAPPG